MIFFELGPASAPASAEHRPQIDQNLRAGIGAAKWPDNWTAGLIFGATGAAGRAPSRVFRRLVAVHLAAAEGPASRAAPPTHLSRRWIVFFGGRLTDLPGPAYVLPVSSPAEIPGSPTTCSEARALRPPSSTFGPDGRAGFGPHAGFWSGFGAVAKGDSVPKCAEGGPFWAAFRGRTPSLRGPKPVQKLAPEQF